MNFDHHYVSAFDEDSDGFIVVTCHCGDKMEGFPDEETAIDALMNHAYAHGFLDGQQDEARPR